MKGCTISEFIDDLFSCPDIEYEYAGTSHLLSIWKNEDTTYTLRIMMLKNDKAEELFVVTCSSLKECIELYEDAAIYDGYNIYSVEDKITVICA